MIGADDSGRVPAVRRDKNVNAVGVSAKLVQGWSDVAFRHCGRRVSPQIAVDRCDDFLKTSEVVVRLINAPAFNATLHPDAYGVTYVVRETNRGWLATVFPDRIGQAAARAVALLDVRSRHDAPRPPVDGRLTKTILIQSDSDNFVESMQAPQRATSPRASA